MKKVLVSLVLVIVMIFNMLALAGCDLIFGGNNGKTTITFYHTMGENLRTVLDKHIANFNVLYPNIEVLHEQVGSYDDVRDQIKTQLVSGKQPNIAYCYPDHVALYNDAMAVLTLDDFINSTKEIERADGSTEILGLTEAQIADFIPAYYDEGRQFGDDLMYTMPFSKSTEVLYYNKTFFDEHDLKVPTTWAELEDVCAKIKAIDKNSIPLGYDSEANWFITMTEQLDTPYTSATGDHFLFDTAENREFCAMFREWYLKGYVTTQEILGSYTSSLFTSKDTTKSYMSIGSSAGATHQRPTKNDDGSYPFEVGIAPIPQVDVNNPKVISQGPSVCIFDGHSDAEEEASWIFVKYLITSVEFQADFSIASGYVPVIKSVNTDPFYAQFLNKANGGEFIAALSAKVCLEQADAYYVSPAFNGSSDARDQVGILLQACLLVKADVADPMAEIKKLFEAAVRECEYKQ